MNGVNIENLRHAEVVALIKRGGSEARLLVVDPDTDEHFKKQGVTPLEGHVEGGGITRSWSQWRAPVQHFFWGEGTTFMV